MNRYNKGFPEDKKFKMTFRLSANKTDKHSCLSVLSYENCSRDSARCVASCRLRHEPLRRKAGAPLLRVNSPASLLHDPFLSATGSRV